MANDYARHALAARLLRGDPPGRAGGPGAAVERASAPRRGSRRRRRSEFPRPHPGSRDARASRPLIYAFVDLPTNAWRIADAHLRDAFGPATDEGAMVVIPTPGEAGPAVADTGTGPHYASPETHGEACRRALDRELPPATVVSLAGIPLHRAGPAAGRSAHRGDRDNNALDRRRRRPGFQRLGLPRPPRPRGRRRAARLASAAERQWERLSRCARWS